MATKTIKDFTWSYGIKLVCLITALGSTALYAANRYTIGLDTQDTRCLDEWVYVIDTWDKPRAYETRKDQYIAVRLTADQTPKGAKWRPGQVMVKRVLASHPGDRITVTETGVQFQNEEETWSHGDGLAAATLLAAKPEAYLRTFVLSPHELFLMGDNPLSYDGRYYGQVSENQIVGTVVWAF